MRGSSTGVAGYGGGPQPSGYATTHAPEPLRSPTWSELMHRPSPTASSLLGRGASTESWGAVLAATPAGRGR